MDLSQKDIKLLWGRSGNRCAICRIELSQDKNAIGSAFTLGEQAHIVGEKEDASRGVSILTEEERNSYHNRILLCPNHHTEIDKDVERFPVEQLHHLKSIHELWVRETLADSADLRSVAKQIAVTSIIDSAVELCQLSEWKYWTQGPLAPDPHWSSDFPERIFEFRQRVAAAIWPDSFDELKIATDTLSNSLHSAISTFLEHADLRNGSYVPYKFYKADGYNHNYDRDLLLYRQWLENCYETMHQATRAANWFAEIVRRDINPMFFAETGKFMVIEGPFVPSLKYEARILEFTEEERLALLHSKASS
jgi:hypothetical protein